MSRPGPGRPPRRGRCGAGRALPAGPWGRSAPRRSPWPSGDLDAPPGELVVDLELDRGILDPPHVIDQLGERGGPAAGLAAEDRPERLALTPVGAFVDEEPHRRTRLAGPDVALERADRNDVQPIQLHVAVVTLADVPGEDAVALAVVGC